jgi:uncharacterized damage-inducible protein DinB
MNKLYIPVIIISCFFSLGCSTLKQKSSIKPLLKEQLQKSYINQDWFVPLKLSLQGLSIDRINWKDSSGNPSIGEEVSHLIFWNQRLLLAFQGNKSPNFDEDSKRPATKLSAEEWENNLATLESIQYLWGLLIDRADKNQVAKWSPLILNMCSHNAYHTGQITYIRKANGWLIQSDLKP